MALNSKRNPKIRVAIIGGGFDSTIAQTHFRAILATNKYEIKCGCFTKKVFKNKKNSEFYSLPKFKIYNKVNDLIFAEKNNIDLAIVLTPPIERNKIYSKLAKNNIGIISEKPFEANFNKAKKIFKLIERKKIFFVTTYNYLGYPAVMELKLLLKKIGEINNLALEMPQQASTLINNRIKEWRIHDKTIPNLHLDLASHLLSIIIFLIDKNPIEVLSFENKNKKNLFVENAHVWLKFKKHHGTLWFSKNATGRRNDLKIEIFGSKGSVCWSHTDLENLKFFDNKGNIKIINRLSTDTIFLKNKKLFTYSPGHPSGFLESFINVYNEIFSKYYNQKHLPIFLDLKKNLDIIKILHKIHTSSKKRKWQKI